MKTLVSVLLTLASAAAGAQGYPAKPITLIIPFAAGGDSDLSGRNVAVHAQKYLNNQPIVPVNRAGASGAIGTMWVKNAAPDAPARLTGTIGWLLRYFCAWTATLRPERSESPPAVNGMIKVIGFDG